ncbi:MAG: GHKL domain-containing protein [Bacteroidetes bacterium]|nr:GHKL domain-containing protein [Bacteroidota bacterium]
MNFLKKHIVSVIAFVGIVLLLTCLIVDTVQTLSPNINRAKGIIENALHKEEIQADAILNSKELMQASDDYSKLKNFFSQHYNDDEIYFYVYKDDVLKYWTSNAFIPENVYRISAQDITFLKEANGFYEVLHKTSDDGRTNIYALIPVFYQYATSNKFLENGFVWKSNFLKRFVISNKKTAHTTNIKNWKGADIFSVRIADNANEVSNPYTLVFEILGLLLLFWSMYQVIKKILIQGRYFRASLILLTIVVLTDVLFNQLKLFSLTKTSLLFSSNLYASSYLSDTLGTLLIRVFMVTWILSLLYYVPTKTLSTKSKNWILAIPVVGYFLTIMIIQSVIQNSVISFNFYLLNTLSRYTFISLMIFGLAFAGLVFLMKWIVGQEIKKDTFIYSFIFVSIAAGIAFFCGVLSNLLYAAFIILWWMTFTFFFYYEKSFFPRSTKYKFLSNLILLSLIAFLSSVVIIFNTTQKDIEKRKYRIKELVSEQDIGEEYTLTETENQIEHDYFIKSYFNNPYISTVDIEQRISSKYYKPLLRRYSLNIYTFDKEGASLIGTSKKGFYTLLATKNSRKLKQISSNFYYLPFKDNGVKYLGFFPINQDSARIGYLFVEFVPKIFSSYSAYPELLLKQKNYYDEEFDNFSYAIYDTKYLIKQRGDYEYQVNFNFPIDSTKEFSIYKTSQYTHTIYYSTDKQVVMSEKNRPALGTLSVFSYLLIFFILFFMMIDLFGISNKFWGEDSITNFLRGNTLQKQIQNSMMALVLFSLAIIALVTMFYFQYQYNIYHNSKLLKKVNTVMKNVSQYYVDAYPIYRQDAFDQVIAKRINILSSIHALDINVYNTKGELLQTSQPEIFKRNLISGKMDADAYYNLIVKGKSKYVHNEQIGKLDYLSAYQPLRSNGKVLGYFNFPYYGKQKSFQEDLSYFLVALANVYVLFLIAAALLAVFLSRSITNSLTLISDNIRDVQFGKPNKKIQWKNDDEIGLLVQQYNLMLTELEKSANLLAKSEREGAWREMAKQVAHEIKNPLTPMKLSIQHLQRALKDNSPDIQELTEKISQRLIEQIDNLSNIATAFSDFAKMPQGEFKEIDIEPILVSTVDLFNETEGVEIHLELLNQPCFVFGDKEQLMRVFTNIIKNATQAIPENKIGIIEIKLTEDQQDYIISIKDNGVGIPDEKRTHIFEPNFTTKSSGTGLGLAISKNIIERMNGKINFNSKIDAYSVFYIHIPKWKQA